MSEVHSMDVFDRPPIAEDVSAGFIKHGLAELQTYETFDVTGFSPEMQQASEFRSEQKQALPRADFLRLLSAKYRPGKPHNKYEQIRT